MKQKRAAEYGMRIGRLPCGPLNQITDAAGARVGHSTVREAIASAELNGTPSHMKSPPCAHKFSAAA